MEPASPRFVVGRALARDLNSSADRRRLRRRARRRTYCHSEEAVFLDPSGGVPHPPIRRDFSNTARFMTAPIAHENVRRSREVGTGTLPGAADPRSAGRWCSGPLGWRCSSACFALRCIHLAWNWDMFRAFPSSKLLEAFAIGLRFDVSAAAFLCAGLLPLALIHLGPRWSRWRWNLYAWILLALTLPLLVLQTVDSELARVVGQRMSADGLFLYGESDWHFADIAPAVRAARRRRRSPWPPVDHRGLRARRLDHQRREPSSVSSATACCITAAWSGGLLADERGGADDRDPRRSDQPEAAERRCTLTPSRNSAIWR